MEKESKKSNNSNGRGGKRSNAGRPKGSLDKGNALIRELIVQTLDDLGGTQYLSDVAKSHPAAFLSLLGKVMPVQLEGAGGGAIQMERVVRFVRPEPKAND
jgi:hypothetical protein